MVVQWLLLFDTIQYHDEKESFMTLALSSTGSRLLQYFIEVVCATTLLQWQYICLKHALTLIKHRHGNFVVTKLIQESPAEVQRGWYFHTCISCACRQPGTFHELVLDHRAADVGIL